MRYDPEDEVIIVQEIQKENKETQLKSQKESSRIFNYKN